MFSKSIYKLILFGGCIFLMISCDSQFSKYKKSGETDAEENRLNGNVKEVVEYWFKKKRKVTRYNKWGFYEYIEYYEDGSLHRVTKYKYDEFGKLVEERSEYKDSDKAGDEIVYYYEYDEHHNMTKSSCVEVKSGEEGEKQIKAYYKNYYNENGVLIKVDKHDGLSTEFGNYYVCFYDLNGRITREDRIDENGNRLAYMAYAYYADGSLYRSFFLFPNGQVSDYWEELYEPTSTGNYKEPYKRIHYFVTTGDSWVQEFKYDRNRNCIYYSNGNKEGFEAEYKYDNNGNWIYRKEKPLFEQGYYDDGEGGSLDYSEEKREITYY